MAANQDTGQYQQWLIEHYRYIQDLGHFAVRLFAQHRLLLYILCTASKYAKAKNFAGFSKDANFQQNLYLDYIFMGENTVENMIVQPTEDMIGNADVGRITIAKIYVTPARGDAVYDRVIFQCEFVAGKEKIVQNWELVVVPIVGGGFLPGTARLPSLPNDAILLKGGDMSYTRLAPYAREWSVQLAKQILPRNNNASSFLTIQNLFTDQSPLIQPFKSGQFAIEDYVNNMSFAIDQLKIGTQSLADVVAEIQAEEASATAGNSPVSRSATNTPIASRGQKTIRTGKNASLRRELTAVTEIVTQAAQDQANSTATTIVIPTATTVVVAQDELRRLDDTRRRAGALMEGIVNTQQVHDKLAQKEVEQELNQGKISKMAETLTRALRVNGNLKAQYDKSLATLRDVSTQLQDARVARDTLKVELARTKEAMAQSQDYANEVATMRLQIEQYETSVATIPELNAQILQLEARARELQSIVDNRDVQVFELTQNYNSLYDETNRQAGSLEEHEIKIQEMQNTIAYYEAEFERANNTLASLQQELADSQAKVQQLQQDVEQRSKEFEAREQELLAEGDSIVLQLTDANKNYTQAALDIADQQKTIAELQAKNATLWAEYERTSALAKQSVDRATRAENALEAYSADVMIQQSLANDTIRQLSTNLELAQSSQLNRGEKDPLMAALQKEQTASREARTTLVQLQADLQAIRREQETTRAELERAKSIQQATIQRATDEAQRVAEQNNATLLAQKLALERQVAELQQQKSMLATQVASGRNTASAQAQLTSTQAKLVQSASELRTVISLQILLDDAAFLRIESFRSMVPRLGAILANGIGYAWLTPQLLYDQGMSAPYAQILLDAVQ